ncbi:MAG: carbon-nitrogen hydrolase family protein [Oscillospiraceae bacterium]|nr:carbon-nitrogen hydrolase family protein [Oscillospiraceae bacterium]
MGKMKLGLVQVDNRGTQGCSVEQKLDHLYGLGEACLSEGADLVFFPEAYQYVGAPRESAGNEYFAATAAKWKERCAGLARQYRAYVAPWDYEVAADGKKYNSTYILDRGGAEIGRYRKVHLTHGELVNAKLTPGNDFPVFDLDFGRVGVMICFDNYFPECARILGLRGAELILYPLYGDTLTPQWDIKMMARAIDNQLYVAPCQLDDKYNIAYTGLINPWGKVVCSLDASSSHQVVEIELGRQVITSTNGQPQLYHEYIGRYLEKVRNIAIGNAAYGTLLEKSSSEWSWEEIYDGNPPKPRQ